MTKLAVIGGSGVGDSEVFEGLEWNAVNTGIGYPFGIRDGVVEYVERPDGVIFIPRHGRTKKYGPARTQYAANIVAAYELGARAIIATSAVGSLTDRIKVESAVVPDDYIDESGRDSNLFGKGFIVHVAPRPPFSQSLRDLVCAAAGSVDWTGGFHNGGTYVTIPGDSFGTNAEGRKRAQYADIVGMTACPEASMAMQAGLHYALIAFPVDMDRDANHEGGTIEIMHRMRDSGNVKQFFDRVIPGALELAGNPPLLPQLKGNIIPHSTGQCDTEQLKRLAEELKARYC